MAKSNGETVVWSLFAAGGVVAAMLIPALILITGIVLPLVDKGSVPVDGLARSLLGRLVLFVVISLPLFHCANRLFHMTKDFGIHGARGLIGLLCYGGAVVGTGVAGWLVCTL